MDDFKVGFVMWRIGSSDSIYNIIAFQLIGTVKQGLRVLLISKLVLDFKKKGFS